jgi:nitrate/nitrite transport system substrate-binding protein
MTDKANPSSTTIMPQSAVTRRGAIAATAATLAAVKAAFPSGAHAAGPGPETSRIRLGFIALTDSAPLIVAKERGIFTKYGLSDVELVKQASWAATRDNLALGSEGGGIDGAHLLTPMAYMMAAGTITNGRPVPMSILARLNLNGQGISASNALKPLNLGMDSSPLKARFAQMKAAGDAAKVAMTFRGGTHDLWVRYWLAAGGIDPDRECSMIVIPPPQMVANMRTGTQDLFCVGEPWNGQLVSQNLGYSPVVTSELWQDHPEKSLAVRSSFVDRNPRTAQALTAAIMEAQQWCDPMANRQAMCSIVSGRQYVNVPIGDILPRLRGQNNLGVPRQTGAGHHMKYWANNASFPYRSHDLWFLTELLRWNILPNSTNLSGLLRSVNRSDIWRAAARQIGVTAPASDSRGVERFFDGKTFNPAQPSAYLASLAIKR